MTEPMVAASGVRKSFGRLEVLRGIDLTVDRGEVLCLIGPSGSGKSTFLRCINHLEKIDGGELSVDGELVGYRASGDKLYELRDREVCAKRAEIGMVFQRFNLFPHMSVLDNVISGPVRVKKEPAGPGQGAGPRAARPGRPGRQGGELPEPALRRPAAAGGHRPGPGHGAQADALRRAHLGPRPRAGRATCSTSCAAWPRTA